MGEETGLKEKGRGLKFKGEEVFEDEEGYACGGLGGGGRSCKLSAVVLCYHCMQLPVRSNVTTTAYRDHFTPQRPATASQVEPLKPPQLLR